MTVAKRLTKGLRCREIHVSDPDAQAESGLTTADQKLMIGALEYKDKRCPPCACAAQ